MLFYAFYGWLEINFPPENGVYNQYIFSHLRIDLDSDLIDLSQLSAAICQCRILEPMPDTTESTSSAGDTLGECFCFSKSPIGVPGFDADRRPT